MHLLQSRLSCEGSATNNARRGVMYVSMFVVCLFYFLLSFFFASRLEGITTCGRLEAIALGLEVIAITSRLETCGATSSDARSY